MEANNKSRNLAKDVAFAFGWEKEGNGNFFRTKRGDLVNFTLTTKGKIESRQFRLDCDYLVSYDDVKNKMYVHRREDLQVKGVTRIGADGTKYYQANLK